jgi:hypothetical protein
MLVDLAHMLELARAREGQGVLFFMWLYTSLVCTGCAIHLLLLRRWPVVQARLRVLEPARFGAESIAAHRHWRNRVQFEYEVAGRAYVGTRLSPWKMVASGVGRLLLPLQARGLQAQMVVQAIHHPRRHDKAYLRRPGWGGIGLLLLLAAAGPLGWYWRYGGPG